MTLEYKILWIDDQTDDIRRQIDLIKLFVHSEGFVPHVVEARTNDEIARRVQALSTPAGSFDLTVVDFHLADGKSGAHVASAIRNKSAADVIFYSAANRKELLRQLHDLAVDGVFVATRRDILPRVREIIAAHIRWAVNVTAMRGISTSLVSEIDHLIHAIIEEASRHPGLGEPEVVRQIIEFLRERQEEQLKRFDVVAQHKTIEALASEPAFSSDVRFKFLKKIWNRLPDNVAVARLRDNVARYDERVLVHRNTLAHGKAVNGGVELGPRRKLSASELRELRMAIRDHHLQFTDLLDQLRSLSGGS